MQVHDQVDQALSIRRHRRYNVLETLKFEYENNHAQMHVF